MIGGQKGHAQAGNIERGGVIPRAIPATGRAMQPRTPIDGFFPVVERRGAIGVGGFATVGAGVRGAARLNLACPDPKEMTLVLEHAPQLASHRRVVPPVPPPSSHPSTTPFGFEGG